MDIPLAMLTAAATELNDEMFIILNALDKTSTVPLWERTAEARRSVERCMTRAQIMLAYADRHQEPQPKTCASLAFLAQMQAGAAPLSVAEKGEK